jgi:hypothetical protein
MKANKTMEGQAVPNHRKRKGKKLKSNIDSATDNQTLNQQRQLNDKNHHILSILTLNVNGLKSPIKRHLLANWIKKEDPTIFCLQKTHFIDRNKDSLEEDLPKLWPPKTCKSSNVYLGQSRLQTYIDQMR